MFLPLMEDDQQYIDLIAYLDASVRYFFLFQIF
jgi:hypothetical protein